MRPRVSVVVPTHDRARLLSRALDSVFAQSWRDFEVVVVDDGSTDDTAAVLRSYDDRRLRVLHQAHSGANPARNLGARAAAGDLLTFLDSDDAVHPDWLRRLVAAMAGKRIGVAFCGVETRRPDGSRRVRNPVRLGPAYDDWVGLFNDGAFLVRRELFAAVGGYAEDLLSSQHTELGFRLVDRCSADGWGHARIDEPLVVYFEHEGPRIRKDPRAVLQGTEYLLRHYPDRLRLQPDDYHDYLAVAATQATHLGLHARARRYYWLAVRTLPRRPKSWLRWAAACARSAAAIFGLRLTRRESGG